MNMLLIAIVCDKCLCCDHILMLTSFFYYHIGAKMFYKI